MNNLAHININARELLRDQRNIIERVKETKQSAIVYTNKEPQVAIVPLEDVEELRFLRAKEALERLIKMASEDSRERKDNPAPSDLSVNHDKYFAEAFEENRRVQ